MPGFMPSSAPNTSRRLAALLGAMAMLAGCGDPGLTVLQGALEVATTDPSAVFSGSLEVHYGELRPVHREERTLVLRNSGRGPISLCEVRLEQPESSDLLSFAVDLRSETTLEPGSTLPFVVSSQTSATPNAYRSDEVAARLQIRACGARPEASEVLVTLGAISLPEACKVAPVLDFGAAIVWQRSTARIPIANPRSEEASARLGIILPSPGDGDRFRFSDTFPGPLPLAPSSVRDLPMEFYPNRVGPFSAKVLVQPAADCEPTLVALLGEGREQTVTWTPSVIDCGVLPPSAVKDVELRFTNASTSEAHLTAARLGPGDAGLVGVVLPPADWGPSLILPARSTVARVVRCAPIEVGATEGELAFDLDVPGQPTGVLPVSLLSGFSDIDVAAKVEFGPVAFVGDAGVAQTRPLRIWNRGAAPAGHPEVGRLTLGRPVADGGAGGSWFSIVPTNPNTAASEFEIQALSSTTVEVLPAPNSVDLRVKMTPGSVGAKAALLTIFSDDADEPSTQVVLTADARPFPDCQYQTSESQLEFGVVHSTDPLTRVVRFENMMADGGGNCLLSDVGLAPTSSADFALVDGPIPFREVPPGGTVEIPVRLLPSTSMAHSYTARASALDFQVSSTTAPAMHVPLTGGAGPACLAAIPRRIAFGALAPSIRSPETSIEFVNLCVGRTRLLSAHLEGGDAPQFELTLQNQFADGGLADGGVEIPENDWEGCAWYHSFEGVPSAKPASIRYSPTRAGRHQAALVLEVVQLGQRLIHVVALEGEASASPMTTDRFVQGGGDPVDILLVVWYRLEFEWSLNQVAANMAAFVDHLVKSGNDFHIGVVRTEGPSTAATDAGIPGAFYAGLLQSGATHPNAILSPTTPSPVSQLQSRIAFNPNGVSTDLQTPSYNVWRALVPPHATGANAGFLRDEARLAVIYLTPQGDSKHLVPGAAPVPPWALSDPVLAPQLIDEDAGDFVRVLLAIKGETHPERLTFAALAGLRLHDPGPPDDPTGSPCNWLTDWAISPMYPNPHRIMAAATRGYVGEACPETEAEWPDIVEHLAESATGLRTHFALSTKPVDATAIAVLVNGVLVPPTNTNGGVNWEYHATETAIHFPLAATPSPGATVAIRYVTAPGP